MPDKYDILADFPSLTDEDTRAVIAFAAAVGAADLRVPAVPLSDPNTTDDNSNQAKISDFPSYQSS